MVVGKNSRILNICLLSTWCFVVVQLIVSNRGHVAEMVRVFAFLSYCLFFTVKVADVVLYRFISLFYTIFFPLFRFSCFVWFILFLFLCFHTRINEKIQIITRNSDLKICCIFLLIMHLKNSEQNIFRYQTSSLLKF